MKDRVYIDETKPQWKGNMHMHSVRSDGCLSPEELIEEYHKRGYAFCQISDHDIYWDNDEFDTDEFILLSGTESSLKMNVDRPWLLEYRTGRGFRHMHFGCIKDETRVGEYIPFSHDQQVPRVIDRGIDSWNKAVEILRERGNLVCVNHPNWSRLDPELMLAMQGCFAIEIWNSGDNCACGGHDDCAVWDYCLQRGKRIYAVAGDDAHGSWPTLGVSFTMVSADKLSKASIVEALKKGDFYASCGPVFQDIRVENGMLKMKFSPVKKVVIVGYESCGSTICAEDNRYLESCEWPIKPHLKYIRPMIIDEKGQTAWAQPIFIEDLMDVDEFALDSACKETL